MAEPVGEEMEFMPEHDMMELFEELSFSEKWRKVFDGLKMPPDSGEYKFARLQLLRLMAPISAVVVPILAIGIIAILAQFKPPPPPPVEVMIKEPDPVEELDDIEEIKEEPPEPPDPVEISEVIPDVDVEAPNPSPPVDFSPVPAKFDSVAQIKSPIIMKGILGSRSPGARGAARAAFGGNNATEGAVMRALRWLAHTQKTDGSWDGGAKGRYQKARTGMTGMGLLTFLAHGETPASEEFGSTVELAIEFLVGAQKGDGHFDHSDKHEYSMPIAAYALSEASALVRVSSITEAATKAIDAIVKGQHASGGWNYNLNDQNRDDTSYMGWCAQALKAGKMAGLDVEGLEAACKKSIDGFKKNAHPNGGFGYTGKGQGKLDGVGVLCMQLHGAGKEPEAVKGLENIKRTSLVDWDNPKGEIYFWYYNTQAMFHHGGADWKTWNKQFATTLVKNQTIIKKDSSGYVDHNGEPKDIGYWDGEAVKERHTAGPTQDTCLCALQLQVYYRYLPTYKAVGDVAPPPEEEEKKVEGEDVDVDIRI
jgi:hypothetical protein